MKRLTDHTLYELLGLQKDASEAQIRKAHRMIMALIQGEASVAPEIVKEYKTRCPHLPIGENLTKNERDKIRDLLDGAKSVLFDSERRKLYDLYGQNGLTRAKYSFGTAGLGVMAACLAYSGIRDFLGFDAEEKETKNERVLRYLWGTGKLGLAALAGYGSYSYFQKTKNS
ncbi:hypothetical protein A3K63_00720 [Candidatus Micrarchaeota archaeon RBG_16_49_10]|nr:MAG: hypothetical protein A3K63_00720 [Candidatus Micrarchaeota archaeon RBG_16_49_10]